MRVAFLTTEYPTEHIFAGGLASYLHRTAKALMSEGHQVEVFTLSHCRERFYHGRVLVHRVPSNSSIEKRISRVPYIRRYHGIADVIGPSWRLTTALHKRHCEAPFDIIQASNYRACGLVAAFWKLAPIVTRASSYGPLLRNAYQKPLTLRQLQIERAEVLQFRWCSAIYSPSSMLADILHRNEGLAVSVLEPPFYLENPTAICISGPAALQSGTYALFFGTVGLLKGCDRLVKVLPGLLDRNRDMKFVFVGRIGQSQNGQGFDQYIKKQLATYGDRVLVLSEQRHPYLLSLVQNSRFVVLPSKIDNLPNTCMEAMALKRVVIGTHGASFDQLIEDGVNGFLVSQEDDTDLSDCMNRDWHMRPEEREQIGSQALKALERMEPRNAIRQLTAFFSTVISQTANRKPDDV